MASFAGLSKETVLISANIAVSMFHKKLRASFAGDTLPVALVGLYTNYANFLLNGYSVISRRPISLVRDRRDLHSAKRSTAS